MAREDGKPLVWLRDKLKTPPMSSEARMEGGMLLRRLQRGENLSMPESRPMRTIGPGRHELRVADIQQRKEWRIVYYIGEEVVAVLEVFAKTTRATPDAVIAGCRRRLAEFRRVAEDK